MSAKSKKTLYLLGAIILIMPVAIFSCRHYYMKSVVKNQVDQFALSTMVLFQEKLDSDDSLKNVRDQEFQEEFTLATADHPLMAEFYAQDSNQYRFIKEHEPTKAFSVVMNRVKGLYDDGVDLAPFAVSIYEGKADKLVKLNKEIIDASTLTFTEEEKQFMVDELDKYSKNKNDDMSPLEMLDFLTSTKNKGKFPKLAEAWDKAYKLAQERAALEAQLEAGSAKRLFMTFDALLANQSLYSKAWGFFNEDPQKAIDFIEPKITHYADLKKGLKKYRALAKKPYEPYYFKASYGTKIKKGSSGANGNLAIQIKRRLAAEGYWDGDESEVWDDALTDALTKFQENHQVVPDGVYGHGTARAFNVSITERVNQIKLSMARLRESNGRWDNYYVRINVPQMLAEVRENQKIIKAHKLVVGNPNPKNHTPQFSDEIEKINVNPSWFVPDRIIKEEMQPAFDKNPEYFQKMGYSFKSNEEGKVLAVTQPPGYGNALGKVKILFPNKHAVYMHDTPKKHLFSRTVRAFSHGCMRTHKALELARFLLEKDNNPEGLQEFDNLVKSSTSKDIILKHKIPIHIEYVLVSSNDAGEVIFFDDVYKQDDEILAAMNKTSKEKVL